MKASIDPSSGFRSVTARLMVVVVSVVAIGALALLLVTVLERDHYRELQREQVAGLDRSLSEGARLKGATLESYVADYSLWNDMVDFVAKPDPAWAKTNLDASVTSFKLARVWVFDRAGRLTYDSAPDSPEHDVPGVRGPVGDALFVGAFFHTFARSADGEIVELRGAKVQREDDADRSSPALGYLFATRAVNDAYLGDLASLLGAEPSVLTPDEACGAPSASRETMSAAQLVLMGTDGPVAKLCAVVPNPLAGHTAHQIAVMSALALGTGPLLAFGLAVALRSLVTRPLDRLHRTLTSGDHTWLAEVRQRRDEFSTLAELIVERDAALQQQRVLQERVHEASRLASLGLVGAVVAHELNNPLAVVLGNADLLRHAPEDTPLDESATREALDAILSQAERMRDVLDRVRRLAREEDAVQHEPNDLNDIVAHALQSLRGELDRRGIQLQLELTEGLAPVLCDHVELASVVQNLVTNARDAVLESAHQVGRIVVETRPSPLGEAVLLRVTDNGSGIPTDQHASVFEPFITTKRDGAGLGLGLALVRSITERHGGSVRIASGDIGTTFELSFPVAA